MAPVQEIPRICPWKTLRDGRHNQPRHDGRTFSLPGGVFGEIYGDRLLVKPAEATKALVPNAETQ